MHVLTPLPPQYGFMTVEVSKMPSFREVMKAKRVGSVNYWLPLYFSHSRMDISVTVDVVSTTEVT